MKKLVFVLALLSVSTSFAGVSGAGNVLGATEAVNRQLESINQSNQQMNNINDEGQLYNFKNFTLNLINQMRYNLNQLEAQVQALRMPPPFLISQCTQNDLDHGGLTDRGGSMIYKRDNDFRICARVTSANRNVVINSVKYTISGKQITSLSGFGGNTATVFEGKGKDFSQFLPSLSTSAYSKCIPQYGNELQVSYTSEQGERKLIALEINPELINFDGQRKYQVPVCN
ncbi:hypothetical protein SHI21_04270 [Bacteriovorax sp. PP10]|uniref:Uncharacterized protein n=1 Tax=Bacteriovorax antarcticus TaxID=3088717 RepID=A0ABU5VQT7_9BACT|nr:hypothetical protein [Bacteriovorax sp. PP10]MEA9355399.1 hypothetical protein [Bacteriovorax sp. PP10]